MTLRWLRHGWLGIAALAWTQAACAQAATAEAPVAQTAPIPAAEPDAPAADLPMPTDGSQPGPSAPRRPVFDWRPINYQAYQIIRAGNYDTALPYVENGLKSCPDAIDAREAALCEAIFSANRAEIREHAGDLAGAEADLKVFVDRRAAVLPPLDPLNAQALYSRAVFYLRHGRRAEAADDLLATEKIYRTMGAAQRPTVAALETRRAETLQALGRNADAVPLYQDAYALYQAAKGPADPSTLALANRLFTALRLQGFSGAAYALADRVLGSDQAGAYDTRERAILAAAFAQEADAPPRQAAALGYAEAALAALDAGKPPDGAVLFNLLRGLARVQRLTGQAEASIASAQRAGALAASTWGARSQQVSDTLRDAAAAESRLGHYDVALAHLDAAAAMLTAPAAALGRAQIEVERGQILSRAGRDPDAISSHQAMAASVLDSDLDAALKAGILALIGQDIARMSDIAALPTCERAMQLASGAAGLASDYVVGAETCTALGLIALDRAEQGLAIAERASQALWAAVAGQTGVEPALIWQNKVLLVRARALRALKRNDEALVVLREKLAVDKRYDPVVEAETWADYASLQQAMGQSADADDSVSRGLSVLGDSGHDAIRALLLRQRALIALATRQPATAVTAYEAILALHAIEADPLATARTERDLAAALAQAGRLGEAGSRLDTAIAAFRALGPARTDELRQVLEVRIGNANQQNDQDRVEAAAREILPLYAPDSPDALATRAILANALDRRARRADASAMRAEAVRIASARYGANSVETIRTRLNGLYWLRVSGRMTEAEAFDRDCLAFAATEDSMKLACLMATAETELQAGAYRDAAEHDDAAIGTVEDHWDRYGSFLQQAIMQRARAAAAMGDVAGVIRFYDRVHDLARRDGSSRGWVDASFVQYLLQAGEPGNAGTVQARVLQEARQAHDTTLIVTVTLQQAEHLIDTGNAREVEALWAPLLPDLGDAASANRVYVLEDLGQAAAAQGQDEAAAQDFQDAAAAAARVFGIGSPVYRSLLVQRSASLARLGRVDAAESAIQPLTEDLCPAASLAHTEAEMQIALEADDMVAAVQHARIALSLVEASYGAGTPMAASAFLDLAEVEILAGQAVDQAKLADATDQILRQQPGWQAQIRINRVQGMLALRGHDPEAADAAFLAIERMVIDHKGAGSLDVARARANRAAVRLQAGDAAGADALYRQALDLAAPAGHWQNAVWAVIAIEAAGAAERTGDVARSTRLRHDAAGVIPTVTAHTTHRWL